MSTRALMCVSFFQRLDGGGRLRGRAQRLNCVYLPVARRVRVSIVERLGCCRSVAILDAMSGGRIAWLSVVAGETDGHVIIEHVSPTLIGIARLEIFSVGAHIMSRT